MPHLGNFLFFIFLFSVASISAEDVKGTPDQPYNLALKAIRNGDIERAESWAKIVRIGFPNSDYTFKANLILVSIYQAKEKATELLWLAFMKGENHATSDNLLDFKYGAPSEISAMLNSMDMEKVLLDSENGFLAHYKVAIPIDIALPVPPELAEGQKANRQLKYIELGILPDDDKKLIIKDLALYWWSLFVKQVNQLSKEPIMQAEFFVSLGYSLINMQAFMEGDKITKSVGADNINKMKSIASRLSQIALELTEDYPYTDTRLDALKLEKQIKK
jgi:hypothetical protein